MLRFTIPFRPMSVCTISLNHHYLTLSGSHFRTHPKDDVYAPTETLSRHRKSVPYTLPFLNHLRLTLRMTLRKPHPNASKNLRAKQKQPVHTAVVQTHSKYLCNI